MAPSGRRGLLVALFAIAACEGGILLSEPDRASLSVAVASAGGPLAAAAPADSIVVVVTGPEQRRVSGTPGQTVRIDNLPPGTYTVRLEGYAGDLLVWFGQTTVTVQAGQSSTATISNPTIVENLPTVTITAPPPDAVVRSGDPLTLTASAADQEDGDLTSSIEWSSDMDGPLGTGGSITRTLSEGLHTIEALVHDLASQAVSATVALTVAPELQPDASCADNPGYAIATFEDANLDGAVRAALGVDAQTHLTCDALAALTQLTTTGDDAGIASLVGIQNLVALTNLHLSGNAITDVAPLAALTGLVGLVLNDNSIQDIGPLVDLTNLDGLHICTNPIGDFGPLADMTTLNALHLCETGVSDIGVLSGLTALTELGLGNNAITDIGPLGGLTNLETLRLGDNAISDVTPLTDLTKLVDLDLNANSVADISVLTGLTNLTSLNLNANGLTDIGVLSGLTALEALLLAGNSITDVSALGGLTQLDYLLLFDNVDLADVQPLLDNAGIGVGDRVELHNTSVSCTDVAALQAKGATVTSDCGPASTPPTVTIVEPSQDTTVTAGDAVTLDATASDVEDGDLTASISWSSSLQGDLGSGGTLTPTLDAGVHVVAATVQDSDTDVGADTVVITVNEPPVATIDAPVAGSYSERIDIDLSGSADDPEDGALGGLSLAWSSDVSGFLGTGSSLTVSTLSPGSHAISLTATDADGATHTVQVAIEVVAIPGGRIAYGFDDGGGGKGIGVVDSDGTDPAAVHCCVDYIDPAWTPDGSQISFHGGGASFALDTELHLIDPDGTNLIVTSLVGGEFAWGPSGTDVAFTRSAGGFKIYRADVNSLVEQELTSVGQEFDPSWSPDGTQILYENSAIGSIDVIDADGGGIPLPLIALGTNGSPTWSPDGTRIAFESDVGGDNDIWIMDADGSNPVLVTTSFADDIDPSWSPDGEWLAFASDRGGDYSIYVIYVAGTGAPILLDVPASTDETHPAWEPGGFVPTNLQVTTGALPDGLEDLAYGTEKLEASGGVGVHQWSVVAGSLPAGLMLGQTGEITGTPTVPGTASFTVEVESGDGQTAQQALSLTVNIAFTQLVAGREHTCGLDSDGSAFCWGSNMRLQLGDGTGAGNRTSAVAVVGGHAFEQLALGGGHTCGLETGTGDAWCWGWNMDGQLGDGLMTDSHTPVQVTEPLPLSFDELAVDDFQSCGRTAGDVAYCWGGNTDGQVGDSTTMDRTSPVLVYGGFDFTHIEAGGLHTCAVEASSATYCWGRNNDGELGDGTNFDRLSPVTVNTAQSFVELAAGDHNMCARTVAGAAYCWGRGGSGQLGNGNDSNSNTPVLVSGGHGFSRITQFESHTCGLEGGTAYCWGLNANGQLGNSSMADEWSPVAVDGGISFTQISAGFAHTCGLDANGQAYCWGWNDAGQLGDGTIASTTSPVLVRSGLGL